MRLLLSLLLVSVLAAGAFWFQTDGFSVATTEGARRASIRENPRTIPDTRIVTSDGHMVSLRDLLQSDGRIAIVNFMYTRCPSLCIAMGAEFQRLQDDIVEQSLENRVRLLSISFDEADTPLWLERYQKQMSAHPSVWQAVLALEPRQRQRLLEIFGIVVVPAALGQYEHNGAYHLVSPDGRLLRVIDLEMPETALHYARREADALVGGMAP